MKPRPKINCSSAIEACAKKLAPELVTYYELEDDGHLTEIERDLQEALRNASPGFDGYQIAKYLENFAGLTADSELVEILDAASTHMRRLHNEAQREWVKANGIEPPEIGWKVRIKGGDVQAGNQAGVVCNHHPEGTSTVAFEHLGHTGHLPPEDRPHGSQSIGRILEWEKLERV